VCSSDLTTFRIHFPRAADPLESTSETIDPEPAAPHGEETILLVEDDEQVRRVARMILRRSGYCVLDAQSPGDALLICEQHPSAIHLLLTDVVMPRMSGRQLAARLTRIRPEMRVLYMTGYGGDPNIEQGDADADIGVLQKPLTLESLTRKVRLVLAQPSLRPTALATTAPSEWHPAQGAETHDDVTAGRDGQGAAAATPREGGWR
jgi:DNA-binding NtrC family response regulator